MLTLRSLTPLALLLAGAFACGGTEEPKQNAPRISAFTAMPAMVAKNGTTTLSYTVANATAISIETSDGLSVLSETDDPMGTVVTSALAQTTTFVLSATNSSGTTTKEVVVTVMDVVGTPTIGLFSAAPSAVSPGGAAILSWATTNATQGRIEAGGITVYTLMPAQVAAGSTQVMPTATTEYTLIVSNDANQEIRQMTTVTVNAVTGPAIQSFTAAPNPVVAGSPSTLSWAATDATQIVITNLAGAQVYSGTTLNGTQVVTPLANETYTLTATGNGTPATSTVMVTVTQPTTAVVVSFTATPSSITSGASSALAWTVLNAPGGITINDGTADIHTNAALSGTFNVSPTATTVYTLTAINVAGNATAMATVTVGAPQGASITSFTATPNQVASGALSVLAWDVTNAPGGITISDGATVINTSNLAVGTFNVNPVTTTTYTLTAINPAGNATGTVTITVGTPTGAVVNSFTANPTNLAAAGQATLSWNVSNAPGGITITQGATNLHTNAAATGTFNVQVTTTTTYTLTAINPAGNATANVTVTVGAPTGATVVSFTAAPATLTGAGQSVLSWSVTNAPGGIAINAGATQVTTSNNATGTFTVNVAATTTYTLTAINPAGNATANVTVTVNAAAGATIVSFTANPTTLAAAGQSTLSWNVTNAPGGITITNGATNVTTSANATGTFAANVAATTTFTLTAINPAGNATQNVTVTITGAPGAEVEPNNTLATANTLANGAVTGSFAANNVDRDYFAVTVANGGNIRAATSNGAGGCNSDAFIAIVDSSGALITSNDDGGIAPTCDLIDPVADPRASDLAAGTYYIVVAGATAAAGTYTLNVTVGTPSCGNNILESRVATPETCDDGATAANDGCSATCQLEINATQINAPGGNVTVTLPTVGSLAVVRVNLTAGQRITAVAADPGGTTCANADTGINFGDANFALIGQKLDGGPGNCAAILDATVEDPANGQFTNLNAGTYYLVIFNQAATAATGPIQVTVTITNPACGNAIVETNAVPAEQCEAGGALPCNGTCQITSAATITLPAGAPITTAGTNLVADGLAIYRLVVTAATTVRAETFNPNVAGGCTSAMAVAIYNDDFGSLALDSASSATGCSLIAQGRAGARLVAGNYWIVVFEAGSVAVPAFQLVTQSFAVGANPPTMEVEPNDTQATATPSGLVAVGTRTLQGSINTANENDVYSFTVPANQTVTVSARTYDVLGMPTACTPNFSPGDTRIFLEQKNVEATAENTGELAFNDDLSGTEWCSVIAPLQLTSGLTASTFYVRVQSFDSGGTQAGPHDYYLDITVQ